MTKYTGPAQDTFFSSTVVQMGGTSQKIHPVYWAVYVSALSGVAVMLTVVTVEQFQPNTILAKFFKTQFQPNS